jgi:uncharacterized membrane protein YedE/YeeE
MQWLEQFQSDEISLALGLVTGLIFGVFAQQSQFCLRSATIEFWRGKPGAKFSIWLFTFGTALLLTQWLIATGQLPKNLIRQLGTAGTFSGAIIGGTLFGIGMILARGCASRLLVLSATGNLRALVAGLVVTVASQASLRGVASPWREAMAGWWTIPASARDMSQYLPEFAGWALGLLSLALGVWLAYYHRPRYWHVFGALMVGASIALGWGLTAWHAGWSFEVVPIKSVSFTGPSADTLMGLINMPQIPLSFDIGIVMGVFAGSGAAAWLSGQFKMQTFDASTGLSRYLIGAVLMGFGGMLAGGCAVGAGVSGGSIMASTAWLALLFMWLSAGITDRLVDRSA